MANWFTKWFGADEQKASRFGDMTVRFFGSGQAAWPERNAALLARDGYVRNIIAHACIKLVAQSAASIPLGLKKGKQDIAEHELLTLLSNPNPMMDGAALFEALYSWLQISGNGYLEQVTGLGKKPVELWQLRSDRVKVVPGKTGLPEAYEYTVNGNTRRVEVEYDFRKRNLPIFHLRTFNPLDDWYGLSQLDPAAWSVDMHSGASAYNKSLLENSAVPSGALKVVPNKDGVANLDATRRENLRTELERRFQGTSNAGRPMVLEGNLDWVKFSQTIAEMQLTETKRESAREIALGFGVPPMLLGIPGDNTYSNYQEARLAFWRETVIPLSQRTVRALGNWLTPAWGPGLTLYPKTEELDALAAEREQQWDRITQSEIHQLNEKRKLLGLPELPEGNIVIVKGKPTTAEILAKGEANPDGEDPKTKPPKTAQQKPKE